MSQSRLREAPPLCLCNLDGGRGFPKQAIFLTLSAICSSPQRHRTQNSFFFDLI